MEGLGENNVKLPAQRAGLPGHASGEQNLSKGSFVHIAPLNPAYPASAGRGTFRSKEGEDLEDSTCNSHDNENTDQGACHQENRAFHPSFLEKEADDARRKNSKPSNRKSGKQDQSDIPQGHHLS